jgi:hypothetical protein
MSEGLFMTRTIKGRLNAVMLPVVTGVSPLCMPIGGLFRVRNMGQDFRQRFRRTQRRR